MIYDKRAELARYFGLSPNLDAAIRFLQTTDLTALPMGRTEIPGGDIYYNHFTYTTALISQASLFEAHERYLDLHIVLSGCEQVALAPVESLDEAEVRADEDSTMYLGTPEYSVTLDQNRFLLVFPGDIRENCMDIKNIKVCSRRSMPVAMTRATPPPSAPVLRHVIFWKKGGAQASTWAALPASTSETGSLSRQNERTPSCLSVSFLIRLKVKR